MDMQIRTETTPDFDMKLTIVYGPVLLSVILDPNDEDTVIDMMRLAFKEARAARNGDVLTH